MLKGGRGTRRSFAAKEYAWQCCKPFAANSDGIAGDRSLVTAMGVAASASLVDG
jgi:hypothetical protein